MEGLEGRVTGGRVGVRQKTGKDERQMFGMNIKRRIIGEKLLLNSKHCSNGSGKITVCSGII